MSINEFAELHTKLKAVTFTREDVDKFLQSVDNSLDKPNWELLAAIVRTTDTMVSDDEKFILIRKPTNRSQYAEMYPHINIDGSIRTFLHYYKF